MGVGVGVGVGMGVGMGVGVGVGGWVLAKKQGWLGWLESGCSGLCFCSGAPC